MPPLSHIWRSEMRYLKSIEGKVRTILERNQDARNDDMAAAPFPSGRWMSGTSRL